MIETSPQNRHLGYARVSTYGQTLDAQLQQFRAEGCAKVYREKASGAQTKRARLRRALDQLAKGDVLTVTRRDRLARSTRDLLNTVATITAKGAGFRSLNDTWADTTTAHGRLILTVLGGLAEFERELIHARTGEGRARAKEQGVKMGRKPKLTHHQQQEAIKRLMHRFYRLDVQPDLFGVVLLVKEWGRMVAEPYDSGRAHGRGHLN